MEYDHYQFIRYLCASKCLRWEDMKDDAQWNLLFDVFSYPMCGEVERG